MYLDFGRSVVHEHGGTDKLLQILQSENARKEGKEQLRTVTTGFLLNLINTYGNQSIQFRELKAC